MRTYSASYNFPPGFLWGTSKTVRSLLDKDNYFYLYQLNDNAINSAVIILNWADYEPLKNNYEETLIESTRNLLSRFHSSNIEPFVILDSGEIPQWQNLEKTNKYEIILDAKYNFLIHLAESIVPYTNIIGIKFPYKSFFSGKLLNSETETFQNARKYIQSLSSQVKTGPIIPTEVFREKGERFSLFQKRADFNALINSDMDFLGIDADTSSIDTITKAFHKNRCALLIWSDNLSSVSPEKKNDEVINKVYNIWRCYQQGWKITGYFSEINLDSDSPEKATFTNICRNNSLELSTENEYLPENWIRFLKD